MAPGKTTVHHQAAVHRLLRYLRTNNKTITYRSLAKKPELVGFVDASWGSCTTSRRSVTGYLFFLCDGPVLWKSVLQKSVALSSTGAEYVALSDAARTAVGERHLLSSLGYFQEFPTTLFEDNTGAISIAGGGGQPQRSRHIDIRYHYIKELIEREVVRVRYIPTSRQLADGLTKSLDRVKFLAFCKGVLSAAKGVSE
jgi:hypothetical protein